LNVSSLGLSDLNLDPDPTLLMGTPEEEHLACHLYHSEIKRPSKEESPPSVRALAQDLETLFDWRHLQPIHTTAGFGKLGIDKLSSQKSCEEYNSPVKAGCI